MAWHHPSLFPVLDAWQRGFPLTPRPFAEIAARHGYTETQLLEDLQQASCSQVLSRVGGVFAPNTVGASTLAAVAVPADRVEHAAACITRYPEVNHNYLREHHYNLWFVVAAAHRPRVQQVLAQISATLDTPVLDLPLEAEYHVDLGFSLQDGRKHHHGDRPAAMPGLTAQQQALAACLGRGMELVSSPYQALAVHAGMHESEVLETLHAWTQSGVLRRLGFIVRHHELGYTANAMCVWQVPLQERDRIGRQLAMHSGVHLCYGRPSRGTEWPYNLFCMVHGKQRQDVLDRVQSLSAEHALQDYPHSCLFSVRRFKQTGALYQAAPAPTPVLAAAAACTL